MGKLRPKGARGSSVGNRTAHRLLMLWISGMDSDVSFAAFCCIWYGLRWLSQFPGVRGTTGPIYGARRPLPRGEKTVAITFD